MTKKMLFGLSLFIFTLCATVSAQVGEQPMHTPTPITVAYVNTDELLSSYPEKDKAAQLLTTLSENYKKELKLMENEYNKKYSDYITYQASLAENIKLRRMQELTELENKMQQFMELAQKDIEEQEKVLLEPIKTKILEAVKAVGIEKNYTVIYDLANPGIAFVSPFAVNANPFVKEYLGIR